MQAVNYLVQSLPYIKQMKTTKKQEKTQQYISQMEVQLVYSMALALMLSLIQTEILIS